MRRTTVVRLLLVTAIIGATVGVSVALAGAGGGGRDAGTTPAGQQDDSWQTFADCLKTHGVDLPAFDDPVALKMWIGERIDSDPTLRAALDACSDSPEKQEKADPGQASRGAGEASGPAFEELRSCLHDHGVDAPSGGPAEFKQWLGPLLTSDQSVRAAAESCGLVLHDGGNNGSKG